MTADTNQPLQPWTCVKCGAALPAEAANGANRDLRLLRHAVQFANGKNALRRSQYRGRIGEHWRRCDWRQQSGHRHE